MGVPARETVEVNRVRAASRSAMLIDDSPLVLATLRRSMESEGWSIRTCRDAATAIAQILVEAPDLVVCDLHMPDGGGLGVIQALAPLNPPPPVIVLSGDDELTAVLEAVRAGAFDYVVKNSDLWGAVRPAVDRATRHAAVLAENRRLAAELDRQLVELAHEVATRRVAEDALRVARDHAVAGNRSKSAFLAGMSHELRTPLNAIIGYAELLSEESDASDPTHRDLQSILSAGRHLLSLVNDVLDLAKIEAGNIQLDLATTALSPLLADVGSTIRPLAARRGNVFVVVCRATVDFYTDEVKLRQCLLNLLGNAAKFTEKGQITLEVDEVGDASSGRALTFAVCDTGIGMTPEQASRVFQAFEQADTSTTRKYGGTGLGLTITRHLAQALGGTLAVTSEVGRGSTFTLRLPLLSPPLEVVR